MPNPRDSGSKIPHGPTRSYVQENVSAEGRRLKQPPTDCPRKSFPFCQGLCRGIWEHPACFERPDRVNRSIPACGWYRRRREHTGKRRNRFRTGAERLPRKWRCSILCPFGGPFPQYAFQAALARFRSTRWNGQTVLIRGNGAPSMDGALSRSSKSPPKALINPNHLYLYHSASPHPSKSGPDKRCPKR